MKYRPEIDGLRAVAIIPVVLFHADLGGFGGGYSGVDVFFVISGFLITSIILSELVDRSFSLLDFYERRARRILPLLFVVLAATLPLAWISLFTIDLIDYCESLVSTILFSSNMLFAYEADYFDAAVDLKPLLHTWSLAVEEQFYIGFPLILMALWRLGLQRYDSVVIGFFVLISFGVCEYASFSYPKYNFFLLPSRAWELLFGALLAMLYRKSWFYEFRRINVTVCSISGCVGLIGIILGYQLISVDTRFPSAYALFPVVGTFLVIAFANQDNFPGRLLAWRPLVQVGLISYSAYLWHHPLFAFVKHLTVHELTGLQKCGLALAVFPLSWLSWKYVENPFRNRKRFNRSAIFKLSLAGCFLLSAIGFFGLRADGFPDRHINTKLNFLGYEPDNRQLQRESWCYVDSMEKSFDGLAWYDVSSDLPNLLLIGNSHSKDMYNTFLFSKKVEKSFDIARVGGQISEFGAEEILLEDSPNFIEADVVVIATHLYAADLPHLRSTVRKILEFGKLAVLVKEPYKFKTVNSRTITDVALQDHLLRGDINSLDRDALVRDMKQASFAGRRIKDDKLKEKADALIDEIGNEFKDVVILDRNGYICDDSKGMCDVVSYELEKFNYDGIHITLAGAKFFGSKIDEEGWLDPLYAEFEN